MFAEPFAERRRGRKRVLYAVKELVSAVSGKLRIFAACLRHRLQKHAARADNAALPVKLDAGIERGVYLLRLQKIPREVFCDIAVLYLYGTRLRYACVVGKAGNGKRAGTEKRREIPAFKRFVNRNGVLQQVAAHIAAAVRFCRKACSRAIRIVAELYAAAPFYCRNQERRAQTRLPEHERFKDAEIVIRAHLIDKMRAVKKRAAELPACKHEYAHAVRLNSRQMDLQFRIGNRSLYHSNYYTGQGLHLARAARGQDTGSYAAQSGALAFGSAASDTEYMNFLPADFHAFIDPGCDRCRFIQERLGAAGISTAVIPEGNARHIYVQYPASCYNPMFKIKTVIAHYDRAEGSPGANDNSAAVFQIMDWAARLLQFKSIHNVRIIFSDGEELPGVAELGSYQLANRFRRLGITNDDVYVFDCCGRGDVLIVSDRASVPPGDKRFVRRYSSLIQRARSLASQTSLGRWMTLPVPYSDNAAFMACGIPAAAFTVLPAEEASAYSYALTRGSLSPESVMRCAADVHDRLPLTWRHMHTADDNIDNLTESAFKLMQRLLDNLAQLLTTA